MPGAHPHADARGHGGLRREGGAARGVARAGRPDAPARPAGGRGRGGGPPRPRARRLHHPPDAVGGRWGPPWLPTGDPPVPPAGPPDRRLAAFASAWLPWAGTRFDPAAASGANLLRRSARLPSRLLWPRYRMRDAGRRIAAFNFETRVEPGALDTDRDVLVIDYAAVSENPLLIKRIRDELVEIVPGAHLGKMLWRHGQGERHTLLAYFALKTPPAV